VYQWFTPIILATQEGEIRIAVSSGPWAKKRITKRAGGVAQGVGPEFKPQNHKKHKTKQKKHLERRRCSLCFWLPLGPVMAFCNSFL
jgi:hypothetical protein